MLARVAHLMFTSSNRLAFSRCCRMRRRGGRCLCLHLQSPIMPAPGWAAVGGAGPAWRPCVASSTSPSCPPPTSPTTHTRRTASTRYHTHTMRRSGKALGMDHRKALSSSQEVHHHPLTVLALAHGSWRVGPGVRLQVHSEQVDPPTNTITHQGIVGLVFLGHVHEVGLLLSSLHWV